MDDGEAMAIWMKIACFQKEVIKADLRKKMVFAVVGDGKTKRETGIVPNQNTHLLGVLLHTSVIDCIKSMRIEKPRNLHR